MSCKKGGFIHARHDEVRDIQAEICNHVEREPNLQPVTGEVFTRSTNTEDEARLDLKARGFWRRGQVAFFDIRMTHPNAPTSRDQTVEQIYHRNEQDKKRQYNDRVKLQLHDVIYRMRFYSNSLTHTLSLSNSNNKVASLQKNRGDKSHRVIVA